jgi:REP element-mobilizing transposase RayT
MRLPNYNYSNAGNYFVTIKCFARINLFGQIMDGEMFLNAFGKIAYDQWCLTPLIRPNIGLGQFVIMPDHIHGIINIKANNIEWFLKTNNNNGIIDSFHSRSFQPPSPSLLSPSQTLGAIIRGYKGVVTAKINEIRDTPGEKVWQRGYHDHIIRNKLAYHRISRYIVNNPKNWKDEDYCQE